MHFIQRLNGPIVSTLILLLFTLGLVAPVDAATFRETAAHTFSPRTLGQDFISPVTTDAKWALLTGSLITATVIATKRQLDEPINDYMQEHRPLGNHRTGDLAGQLIPNILYAGTMLGIYAYDGDQIALRRADKMFRTSFHAGIMTLLMKQIFRAERPYDPNVKTSFPSGHTSSAFSFASAVAMEHEWYWGASAYALATFVGASRINDHQHHFRDVLAGATLGLSYGMAIYYRMNEEQNGQERITASSKTETPQMMALLPTDDLSGAGFFWRRTF